jgi:hypothetical protein
MFARIRDVKLRSAPEVDARKVRVGKIGKGQVRVA